MNVQMGTDAGASNSSTPLTRVALSSWAPLCRDLHIRCPPGAELHVSGSTIPAIFARLSRCRLEQFTVCLATGAGGDVVVGPEAQAAAVAGGAAAATCVCLRHLLRCVGALLFWDL